MKKKPLYILTLAFVMGATLPVFAKKSKSKATDAEKAKQEYVDMTAACRSCEEAVKTDSLFGAKYNEMLVKVNNLNAKMKAADMRHTEALKILNQEVNRGAYHGKAGVKEYEKRVKELENATNTEKESIYIDLISAYTELSSTQKSSYNAIVERRVQQAITKGQ